MTHRCISRHTRGMLTSMLTPVALVGCAGDGGRASGLDSLGDTVPITWNDVETESVLGEWQSVTEMQGDVSIIRTVAGSVWGDTLALVPELTIGVIDGDPDYMFGDVSYIQPMPDGSVWVVDAHGPRLRIYDASGTHIRDVGRRGSGPGEFMLVRGIDLTPSGEVAVWDDSQNGRISIYEPSGEYRRLIHASSGGWGLDGLRVDDAGRFWIATRVFERSCIETRFANGREVQVMNEAPGCFFPAYLRLSPTAGGDRVQVDTIPVPIPRPTERIPSFSVAVPEGRVKPFIREWSYALSPLGYFVTSYSMTYVVRLHSGPGSARTHIVRDFTRLRLGREEYSEWEARAEFYRRRQPGSVSGSVVVPEVKPALRSIWVDEDGRIWVWRYTTAVRRPDVPPNGPEGPPALTWREPVVYDIFEPDGRFLGTTTVPDARPSWSSGDIVWGVERGPLGESYVVRYRLADG